MAGKEENKEKEGKRPVIIVKKGGHAGSHGSWKVAFADFMTSMLALFIVLWILAQSQDVRQNIESYFKDPKGTLGMIGSRSPLEKMGAGVMDNPSAFRPPEELEQSPELLEVAKQKIDVRMATLQNIPMSARGYVEVIMTKEGLRIELTDPEEGVFFNAGSDKPTGNLVSLLKELEKEITPLGNEIVIEGHTDSAPAPNRDRSNWEISASRANSVRRVLEESGFPSEKVKEVRAFADRMPLHKGETDAAQEKRNRRVSILLVAKSKKEKAL